MATREVSQAEIDKLIADEFGVNADYVSELLAQFERDQSSVDDDWRLFFEVLLSNGSAATEAATAEPAVGPAPMERAQPTSIRVAPGVIQATYEWGREAATKAGTSAQEAVVPTPQPQAASAAEATAFERIPIRGPALRIAENMEASLAVPTATSQRQVPLKLLDENRQVINKHLAASGRKVSYTHVAARAILKALESFPQLNDSFEEADESAYRVRRTEVNFGVAVDVTKKDGTRTLLVPNIKGADKLTFSQLLDAYDDV